MKLDVRNFGEFELAFAEFLADYTTRIMAHHQIARHYDKNLVKKWLTDYVERTLRYVREKIHELLQATDPAYQRVGYDVAVTMPRITRTPSNEMDEAEMAYLGTLYATTDEACTAIDTATENELQRTMRFNISFRFVRKSTGHAFKLANVNAVLEEVDDHIIDGENPYLPLHLSPNADPEDETLPRDDRPTTWLKRYTLVGEYFKLGRTQTITPTDIYEALKENDGFATILRSLLGLGDADINDIEVEGDITARVYDQEVKAVNLA